MEIELLPDKDRLTVVFDEEFVTRFSLMEDSAIKVSVANGSICLTPVDSTLSFEGLTFERLAGNRFVAKEV